MAVNTFTNVDGGNWNTGTNWSLGHAPDSTEDVEITASLGTSKTITLDSGYCYAKSIDFSTAGNVFTLNGAAWGLDVYGNITLKTGMTFSFANDLTVHGSCTFTTNEVTGYSNSILLANNSTLILGDELSWGRSPLMINGTGEGAEFVTNDYDCALTLCVTTGKLCTLTLGSSVVTGGFVDLRGTATFTANTATINVHHIYGGTSYLGDTDMNGASVILIQYNNELGIFTGNFTCANLTFEPWVSNPGDSQLTGSPTVTGTVTLIQRYLDLYGQTLTCGNFVSSNSNTREIKDTIGGGKIVLLGVTGTLFDTTTATNLTISNAPDIQIGDGTKTLTADVTFMGAGKTYGDFTVKKHAGNYDCIVTGANTFGVLTLETPDVTYQYSDLQLTAETTTVISSLVIAGTSSYKPNLTSTTSTHATISDSSGTNIVTNCHITAVDATGGATFALGSGASITDGEVGWTPTEIKWSDGQPILAESIIRWSDGEIHYIIYNITDTTSVSIFIKVDDIWKTSPEQMIKINGEWRAVTEIQVKVDGSWQIIG